MRRRDFITVLGGATAWPLAARAQQGELIRRVAALFGASEKDTELAPAAAFREALARLGWIEGRNLKLDIRFGEGDPVRLRTLAAELIGLSPDVAFAGNNVAARALLAETHTIPIVFVGVGGVLAGNTTIQNITRPEANTTGFANKDESIEGKWLELLKEVAPQIARVAFIYADTQTPVVFRREMDTVERAATAHGVKAISIPFHDADTLQRAIDAFAREPNGGLIVNSNITSTPPRLVLEPAARNRLPLISAYKSYTAGGGLMSFGSDFPTLHREAAGYVDRILRGAKAADLPVQFPTKYDLVINLKTAKALGLTVPPSLLATADELIE
jgi:putative ABC transport system substrate-binding protein